MSIKCSLCPGICQEILDLGEQNLANNLSDNQSEVYSTFKLSLVICENCGIQQLDGIVDPTIMFQNYLWVTGTSETTLSYLERLALFCNNYKGVNARVLEIASNDGSFLECMLKQGWSVKGVDPARNIADLANNKGIETISSFFGSTYLDKYPAEIGSYDLVVARNVLPHAPNIREILTSVRKLLGADGKLLAEFHDANQLYDDGQIDYIYHEHKYYFTYNSFVNLAAEHGYRVTDYKRSPISAGSHVIVFEKADDIGELKKVGLVELARYANGGLQKVRDQFTHSVKKIIDSHEGNIIGFGASARASTLLNLLDDDSAKKIQVMLDNSTHKSGFYFSRHRILIEKPESIFSLDKDFVVLVFAWNFFNEIEKQLIESGVQPSQIINIKKFLY